MLRDLAACGVQVSKKRQEIRRYMNKMENEASAKAVDSLLNYGRDPCPLPAP